jgi:dTDP-4-dehydrorhamnose 3,5-epimerase
MRLEISPLALPEIRLIRTARIDDPRGHFAETYVRRDFAAADITPEFVQDNQSRSHTVGTVRGLHFQIYPAAQARLIRVLRGRIFDVAVDLRRSSPRHGKHVTTELSAETGDQLYIPAGFAHGFCTLEPETEVFYKVDQVYSAQHERGVNWLDPTLAIQWPVSRDKAVLSEKDRSLPFLADLPIYFE